VKGGFARFAGPNRCRRKLIRTSPRANLDHAGHRVSYVGQMPLGFGSFDTRGLPCYTYFRFDVQTSVPRQNSSPTLFLVFLILCITVTGQGCRNNNIDVLFYV
jgi:hypothetical protein